MKTLIFADTHLTEKFDQNLCDYIVKLANPVDQVIINGDLWDCHLTNFDHFVNSQWSQLFTLLRSKTIYLYGNHDPKEMMDERNKLLSKLQTNSYQIQVGKQVFHIEHGHRVVSEFDGNHPHLTYLADRFVPWLYPWVDIQQTQPTVVGKLYKHWSNQHHLKMQRQLRSYAYLKRKLAKNTKTPNILWPKTVYVFGHSHLPAHDELDQGFICLGDCRFGKFNYVLINDNQVTFHKDSY